MSIKEYKRSFSGIEPSRELHDSLIEAVLKEEQTMRKANRKSIRPRVAAACAAVLILGVSTTAAAAALDINGIFQNFFQKEVAREGKEPASVPLEAGDDFLTSAGNVIHEETAGYGLKLTVRGTVGDGNVLYAAIDVETEDGSPFSREQEGRIQSYQFGEVMLEGEGIGGEGLNRRYCGLERIDDGSVPGKATFLLSEMLEEDFKGKNIKMSLKNLMMESNEVIDLGMEKSVWELMQEFEPLKIREAEGNGGVSMASYSTEEDAKGNVNRHESFMVEKTDKRIAFSSVYPEARISNLGIFKGQYEDNLIVNLEFGGALDWDLVEQKPLIVLDRRNGQEISRGGGGMAIGNGAEETYFPGMKGQADIVGDDYISCRYCFNGIGEEQAKNAVFALGGDGSFEELVGGEWTLSFTVDYEDTMKTWALEENVETDGLVVKEISISPVSGIVKFDTLSEKELELEDVCLNRKDGSQVKVNAMSCETESEQDKEARILWESVVDLEEIVSITINGKTISL